MEVQNNLNLKFFIHQQEQTIVPIDSYHEFNIDILFIINQSFLFYKVIKDYKFTNQAMQVADKKINLKKRKK